MIKDWGANARENKIITAECQAYGSLISCVRWYRIGMRVMGVHFKTTLYMDSEFRPTIKW